MYFRRLRRAYIHGIDFVNHEVVDVKDERMIKILSNPDGPFYGRFVLPLDEYEKQFGGESQSKEADEAIVLGTAANYETMKRPELVKLAAQRGMEHAIKAKKEELVAWLKEADKNPSRLSDKVNIEEVVSGPGEY